VTVAPVLRPKVPRNLRFTTASALVILVVYAGGAWLWPWSPKRGLGLAFGFVAAFAFVFEMLYPARRPRARPFGTARAWLQAHVYLGVLAFLAVLVHTGLSWPHGAMGWWLLALGAWTTTSGLVGVWLQKSIPRAMADGLQVEALYERIPQLAAELVGEADALVADASDVLERFYREEVRDRIATLQPSWGYVLDVRAGRERALEPFRRMVTFVSAEEKGKVEDLASLLTEKLELEAQLRLQRVLRRWLWLHVPPAGLLMGLVVVHVFAWVWY